MADVSLTEVRSQTLGGARRDLSRWHHPFYDDPRSSREVSVLGGGRLQGEPDLSVSEPKQELPRKTPRRRQESSRGLRWRPYRFLRFDLQLILGSPMADLTTRHRTYDARRC